MASLVFYLEETVILILIWCNEMSMVPLATVETYCGVSPGDATVGILHPAVETEVKRILGRDIELTTYTHDRYDGSNKNWLILRQYPLVEIYRVSTTTCVAFTVLNSSTDNSNSIVHVDNSGAALKLQVVGGVNAHSWASFAFASYPTFATMVAAINAYGKGWSAEISSSDYDDYPIATIIGQTLFDCAVAADVLMPSDYVNCSAEYDKGIIRRLDGGIFSTGKNNIIVSYKAGYSATPADLVAYICQATKAMYVEYCDDVTARLRRYSLGDITKEMFAGTSEGSGIGTSPVLLRYKRVRL